MKFTAVLIIASFAFILFLFACGSPSVSTNKAPQFVSSNPLNNATDVSTDTTLSWTFNDPENDSLTYELFFGENKNTAPSIYKGYSNSYKPNLEPSKTYYWKIIAYDGKNTPTQVGSCFLLLK
ncbi:Ig-like domain-containing protein [Thermotoga profunda]|uniref:Ig-like domain-containing protein n=1 Tax=Thermotoga profunda TaxID=1508420 RepID=UPI000597039B|nr:Ig-like domain-containing protein [Thermotoga profunda]